MNTLLHHFCLLARAACAVATIALFMPGMSRATLLVYESFDYATGTTSGSGVLLNGQSGGVGMTGSWTTVNTGTANSVTNYLQPNLSGVNLNTGVPNTFNGTVTNLPTSGGYFGSIGLGGTANTTDHIYAYRTLDPSVTATFTAGSTTWFSFVSARAFNANATGPKFAIGAGRLSTTDRGQTAQGEAIGAGGGLGINAGSNTTKVYGQFWDQAVAGTGSFQTYDATGSNPLNNSSTTPLNTDPALSPWQAFTWASDSSTGQPIANIVIGKIQWNDSTPDVLTVARFLPTSGTLTEALFDASALPSSTTWPVQPNLDQSTFNTISFAGGRYFADEVRIATTFNEVVGIAPVPEPSMLGLLGTAMAAVVCLRRHRGSLVGAVALAATALALTFFAGSAEAADYTWDDGTLAAAQDPPVTPNGGGVWDITRTVDTILVPGSFNWTAINPTTLLPATTTWVNGNTAVFTGDPYTSITVAAPGLQPAGIKFTGANVVVAGLSTTGLEFTSTSATMTIDVAAGLTGTISAKFNGAAASTGAGNKIQKTGTGTLVLSGESLGMVVGDSNNAMNAGYIVEGGGELQITGGLFKAASTAQSNRGNFTNLIGATTNNNTLRFSTAATAITGGITMGSTGSGNNKIYVSTPGTAAAPSYRMWGNGAQFNVVSSSNNSLIVDNLAYLSQGGGGGTNAWTLGTNAGANNNSIVADSGVIDRRNTAGSFITVGASGSYNSLQVKNGGAVMPRRFALGSTGGDFNTVTVADPGSIAYIDDSTNAWFYAGDVADSSSNGVVVSNGGKFNFTGLGTTRYFTVGSGGTGADSNYLRVTGVASSGPASVIAVNYALPIGVGCRPTGSTVTAGGNANRIDVQNGGSFVTTTSIYVGSSVAVGGSDSLNNVINLGNGSTAVSTLNVQASATDFNTAAGYTGAYALPGNTTPVAVQVNNYLGSPTTGALQYRGVFLNNRTSVLRMNNGRLQVGNQTRTSGSIVSGTGYVQLDGTGYFSIPSGNFNTIVTPIVGSGGLVKEDLGVLALTSVDTAYTGNTTVNGGMLQIAAPFLSSMATVTIAPGALLDLNFDGTNVVGGLIVAGETMPDGIYTWESITSGGVSFLTGVGALMVVQQVPEPGSGLLAAGAAGAVLATLGLRRRRRLR